QAQQLLRVRADEAGDAQALVEGVSAMRAARAGQVEALEADVAGGGQDGAGDAPLVPGALQAVGAAPGRRPFFSAASARVCRAAWTAWRASSRAAGTARASTRARTCPSGAAPAVCSSCLASNSACSTSSACKGASVRNVRGFMAAPWGARVVSEQSCHVFSRFQRAQGRFPVAHGSPWPLPAQENATCQT